MKVTIETRNHEPYNYFGLWSSKQIELIKEAFKLKYAFTKPPKNKRIILNVPKLDLLNQSNGEEFGKKIIKGINKYL